MTKEKGGVAYTSSEFLRELDARLGNTTTKSDRKTLTRDLARLQESGHLEVEVVHMQLSGQDVTRSLFYLTDEGLRPTKEQIDLAREDCKTDSSHSTTKQMPSHRTVESEYTLFAIDSPFKGEGWNLCLKLLREDVQWVDQERFVKSHLLKCRLKMMML